MRFRLLSVSDMKAMDSLEESHGGAQRIAETIEVRKANALKIGDVIYYKTLQCTKHAMKFMKRGIPVKFGQSSRR